ncbi:MAG: purine-nucleoside phosphorylase [Fluviicola sp.]|nr:purine-nucleoside phosphorylase [Fluviicola sp.]MDR0802723.1 purine-nucleoside phosphorylase [Fluviicola sp.]
MLEQMKEAAEYIGSKTPVKPSIGIILGTGLGGLVKEIEVTDEIPYEQIPHFPVSTVESHSGKLIFGNLGGKKVVAMQGRFHFYEGYNMQQVTFPVRVMKLLGIERLFVSNASGGVNPDFEVGEIMILDDHINLFPAHPLIGKNIDELGPRFPDMSEPYDHKMIALAKNIAAENNIRVSVGTYAALTGPTLETPAEYGYVRAIGADAVGMSTIPEVIVARHMEIPCFAISIITDLGVPGKIRKVSLQDVIDVASRQEPKMTLIMRELISKI